MVIVLYNVTHVCFSDANESYILTYYMGSVWACLGGGQVSVWNIGKAATTAEWINILMVLSGRLRIETALPSLKIAIDDIISLAKFRLQFQLSLIITSHTYPKDNCEVRGIHDKKNTRFT